LKIKGYILSFFQPDIWENSVFEGFFNETLFLFPKQLINWSYAKQSFFYNAPRKMSCWTTWSISAPLK